MTVDAMRTRLTEVYPGPKWRLRVMQMPERQVIAIYKNLSRNNKLNKKPKKKKEPGAVKVVQLTIFDLPEMKGVY